MKIRRLMVLILSGLAFQPAVAVAASALVAGAAEMTAAEKETLELIRPGGAGRAYWNQHATWFMYRPKLCFPALNGATNYSYAVIDDHHVNRAYEGRDSETAIPSEAHYAQMVRDMLAWYEADPKDWRGTWRKAADKYGCAACRGKRRVSWDAIDCTVNGAMVLLGFLYGEGDMDRTMYIAASGGYDADCNPSTACGVLGTMIGARVLAPKYLTKLDRARKWDYTDYDWGGLVKVCEKLTRTIVPRAGGRVECDAAGREWLVVPVVPVRPSAFYDAQYPRPEPESSRLTAEESARILSSPNSAPRSPCAYGFAVPWVERSRWRVRASWILS